MNTYILLVLLNGMEPMQATPVSYASLAECADVAAVLALTASSSTVYDCVPG